MPGDEYAWIEAACWLLEDPETLRTLRLNARRHASRQSWMREQLIELCQQQATLEKKSCAASLLDVNVNQPLV